MWIKLLYNISLSDVLGIVAIITAFIVAYVGGNEKPKNRILSWSFIVLLICLFAMILNYKISEKYSKVPNVCGLSYDEALLTLTEAGLTPQFVLSSGNDLSLPTCRVFWQSLPYGKIVDKNEQCFLMLDDYYLSRASSVIKYKFKGKDKTYYAYSSVDKSNAEYPDVKIELSPYALPTAGADNRIYLFDQTRLKDESNLLSTDEFFARSLMECMTGISRQLYDENLKYEIIDLDGIMSFGRLTSVKNKNEHTATYIFDNDGNTRLIVIPDHLVPGEYNYELSVIKNDGVCYEWTIPVVVD